MDDLISRQAGIAVADEFEIIVKYPEWVEIQLKNLDERIVEIYRAYAKLKVRPDEAMRIKKNLYERTKPFIDEKVRLITNCCPTYIVKRRNES